MTELATAYISIVAETSSIPGSIRRALGQADGEGRRAGQSAGRSFGTAFSSSMRGLAGALGVAGGIATIGAGIKSAMTSGMDFTNALNTMQAVAGASSAQVAKVGEVARQLGTDNQLAATSSVDAAQAMLELAKGGFTVEQSMSAARGTLQLAAAAQIDAAEAATIQSQALQAFGLQADQAGRVADVLANAANASSAEITDVAYALAQGGTVAKQFGLSVEDAATTIGLLANAGIQGSDAGTLMKSALLALTSPTEKQTAAAEQLGLQMGYNGIEFKSMGDLFAQLGAASKTLTREQYNSAAATLFGSDAMRLAGVAATQGAAGWDKMRAAMGQSGSAAAVAAAKMQGLPGAWEKLKNAAQDAGLAFYDAVEGPLTSAANKASDVIGDLVTKAQDAGGDLGTALANPELQSRLDRLLDDTKDTFTGLGAAAAGLVPSIAEIASSLAMASAAVGVGTWQFLLTALRAGTTVLDVLNPLLSTTADLMEHNQWAVTGLLTAWVAFRTVPAIMGRVTAAVAPMAARVTAARTSLIGFNQHLANIQRAGRLSGQSLNTFQAGAIAAGRAARGAGSAVMGAFGGPVGLGLTAVAVGGMYVASQMARAKQASEELATASRNLVAAQGDVKKALTASGGAVTDSVVQSQTAMLDQYMEKLKATANTHKSTWEAATSFSRTDNGPAEQAMATSAALGKLGMTNEQLSRAITGSGGAYADLQNRLRGMGSDGQQAATQIGQMRAEFARQQSSARTITPGITELGNAIRTMSDSSASASDKLNALKASMDAMNPARNQVEATAQYGETIRKVAEAAQGIDATAFTQDGQINAMSEAGANLSRTLSDLADKSAQMASTGGDMRIVNQQNEQAFQQLAATTGRSVTEIRALYESLGGETVDMSVELRGSSDVMQRLGQVQAAFNKAGGKKSVEVASSEVTTDTEARLKEMGFTIARLLNGNVRIDANTEGAQAQLTLLTQNMNVINALRANPAVDLNTTTFNAKNDQARQALTQLDQMHVEGEAGLVIDQLLQGKEVSMQQLEILRAANVSPQARLLIDQLLQNAGIAKTELDTIARERTAQIRVQVLKEIDNNYHNPVGPDGPTVAGPGVPGAPNFTTPPRADGAIVAYANGGIRDLEAYANGVGLRTMAKPTRADIYAGRGAGTIFAEEETGGEAYIPLAQGKRGRSTDILAAVASMFGFDLLPQGVLPENLSGLVGGVAGGALSKLLKATGVDGLKRFADGGVSGSALRALAEGRGASRPLTGAPYVLGGVNWGDCCIPPTASLITIHGSKQMKDIRPGDRVLSFVDGKLEDHEVVRHWFSKRQETFIVRTPLRETEASANHPYLRYNPEAGDAEWVRLDELSVGDLLVQARRPYVEFRSNTTPTDMAVDADMAWLMGLILGNGNVQDTRVEVCVYGAVREKAMEIINRIEVPASKTRRAKTGIGCKLDEQHGIRMHSTWFAREMAAVGLRKLSHDKRIPECVWGWSEDLQRAFLTGYADTDGHYTPEGRVSYGSASRGLIDDVRCLHQVLGDVVGRTRVTERKRDIYIKGEKVKNARPLYTCLTSLRSEYPHEGELGPDFTLTPVQAIIPNGEHDTYDIEVEGAHNFMVDGIVVHNSGAMSAFARLAAGLDPFGGRFATANQGEYLAKLGAKSGLKSGAMQFGWYNGGPGGGHTAGTLPDGTNVEMGGGNGGGMLGGSVGANDPQFTNHAYIDVKDEDRYSGGSTDSPTGTGAQQNNPDAAYGGGYTFDPISNDATTGSGDSSISGRLGGVASAFITGQLSSLFELLSVNDQPGWLAAILEYEKQHSEDAKKNYDAEKKKLDEDFKAAEDQRKADYDAAKSAIDQDYQSQLISAAERDNRLLALKNGYETDELGHRHDYENSVIRLGQKYGQVDQDSVGSLSLKQRYENEQLKRSQGLQGDQYARESQFNREKRSLDSLRDAKSISQDEYQRRLGALRSQYDADIRGMRTKYNQDDALAKSNFERSQSIYAPKDRYNPSTVTTEQYHPSDPGTNSSGRTGDPDSSRAGRVTSTGNQIKDAFKSGLREAWRDGQPWTDTDWIITKESNWNPTAVNPSSGAFGLPQFLGATKDKYLPDSSPDPKAQGTAYDHYVGDRYQTPMGARAHWEANNWYDQGGVGIGTGLMAKNVLRPERVLSPKQTSSFEEMVKRDFQSGIGTDRVATLLEQILAALRAGPRGNATYNVGDDAGLRRAEKIEARRHKSAMAGF